MTKEKKVETRDMVYEAVASALIQDSGELNTIRKHKEGLEFKMNDELFAIRVIKKKGELEKKDFRGEYFHDATANAFGYKDYQ